VLPDGDCRLVVPRSCTITPCSFAALDRLDGGHPDTDECRSLNEGDDRLSAGNARRSHLYRRFERAYSSQRRDLAVGSVGTRSRAARASCRNKTKLRRRAVHGSTGAVWLPRSCVNEFEKSRAVCFRMIATRPGHGATTAGVSAVRSTLRGTRRSDHPLNSNLRLANGFFQARTGQP
jgi:hypothetical protein